VNQNLQAACEKERSNRGTAYHPGNFLPVFLDLLFLVRIHSGAYLPCFEPGHYRSLKQPAQEEIRHGDNYQGQNGNFEMQHISLIFPKK
jgi:hypothetical protein